MKTRTKKGYPGGKNSDGVYHRIINQIPPHLTFMSLYFGHCGITTNKLPAVSTIGLDIDPAVIAWWKSDAAPRIPGLKVKRGDALEFLRNYKWRGGEFVYLDPPYLKETRSSKDKIYTFEFWTPEQHAQLLDLIVTLPCMVAISGYWSAMYRDKLQIAENWREIHYKVGTQGGGVRTEYLWMNYEMPLMLHDFRYLGEGFRQREKINRQKRNLRGKLTKMPNLNRYAMLSVIMDLWPLSSDIYNTPRVKRREDIKK